MFKQHPSFIEQFVMERFEAMARAEDRDQQDAGKQGVSIRLQPGKIRVLDHMAKQLDVSRQALLFELVTSGLDEVIKVYSDSFGEESQKTHQDILNLSRYEEGDI